MSTNHLPVTSPEAQGVPSRALLEFLDAAEARIDALHSLMLLRHGHCVARGWWTPYRAEVAHRLFSLSKSFTSTAVGLAVDDGLLAVDDPVIGFFPDDRPEDVGEYLEAMRVRHLLSMTTGHAADTMGAMLASSDGNWARAFLALDVEYTPGTHFLYNTGASYMLSAIVQTLTGETLVDYLCHRLFGPLGIEGARWDSCPRGINLGGFGLRLKTEDIARFGQLYLQGGRWGGAQLVSGSWIAAATSRQADNAPNPNVDWEQGYGYQFWRCRHNVYRGDGAFGQFCIVMPDQDAVLAITSGTGDMQGVLDLVWEQLLPAMASSPLPEAEEAWGALLNRLQALALPTAQGAYTSPNAASVSDRTYVFDASYQSPALGRHQPRSIGGPLKDLSIVLGQDGGSLLVNDGRRTQSIAFGYGAWRYGTTLEVGDGMHKVAASGAWQSENTLAVKLCHYETPFCPTVTCRFEGDEVRYRYDANVAFGPLEMPELVGRAT